jgi:hypothetical protein
MKKFLLVLKGYPANWNNISELEQNMIYQKYGAFSKKLKSEGKLVSGDALSQAGKQIMSENGIPKIKMTYGNTDLVATGFYIIQAENIEEATAISKDCPALTHGDFVELYQMSEVG